MIAIGLTGSMAMGKSTTAQFFQEAGIAVHDSDAAVRKLYEADGGAAEVLADLVPQAVEQGQVDRAVLKALVQKNPNILPEIEKVIHPLVQQSRQDFLKKSTGDMVVFDVPLLFETGADMEMDYIIVVTAPKDIQKKRAMARPGMTESLFDQLLSRQLSDDYKKQKADFIIDTSHGLEKAKTDVGFIIAKIRSRNNTI